MKRAFIICGCAAPLLSLAGLAEAKNWLSVRASRNCSPDPRVLMREARAGAVGQWHAPPSTLVEFQSQGDGLRVRVVTEPLGSSAPQQFYVSTCEEATRTAVVVLALSGSSAAGRQDEPPEQEVLKSPSSLSSAPESKAPNPVARAVPSPPTAITPSHAGFSIRDETSVESPAQRHPAGNLGLFGAFDLLSASPILGAAWTHPITEGPGALQLRVAGWYVQPIINEESIQPSEAPSGPEWEQSWEYTLSGNAQLCRLQGTALSLCGGLEYAAQALLTHWTAEDGTAVGTSSDGAFLGELIEGRFRHSLGPAASVRLEWPRDTVSPYLELAGSVALLATGADAGAAQQDWTLRAGAGAAFMF